METILVAAGGGGLSAGVAASAAGRARVIVVEPEGSTAVHSSPRSGLAGPGRDDGRSRTGCPRPSPARARWPRSRHTARRACSSRRRRSRRRSGGSTRARNSPARLLPRRLSRPSSRAASMPVQWASWCQAATSRPRRPLLSWPGHEGGHPPRIRPRARHVFLRERVHDALDEGRAARRDLLGLPSVLHGQAEAAWTPAAGSSASSAGSRRPAARRRG